MALANWIDADESAKDMLSRVLLDRPLLLLPPLHRVPLRAGNVVEIVGPSPSAKTEVLIQAAISSILPKEWGGVHYGGLERLVIYIDLDCRFDIRRLSRSLKHRISQVQGIPFHISLKATPGNTFSFYLAKSSGESTFLNEGFLQACMRRFLYIRCYNSYELLAVLKTMQTRLQKETEINGVCAHFLMIDSIGAFYWVDRASKSLPLDGNSRKALSLQNVVETVVHELHQLVQAQPMLVLATKATIMGMGAPTGDMKRTPRKWIQQDSSDSKLSNRRLGQCVYREYMPSVWQLFVTHRIFLMMSDSESEGFPVYVSQWLLPSLQVSDKFMVTDAGIFIVT
ncbi:DNA repair protein XRCC2 homolog [Aristolochia californica]|uniref:DNA repair protein XRCC2 homolog n=1 Tax=Aristolochia californica TaxID=171875 RepID=UPI0035DF31E0